MSKKIVRVCLAFLFVFTMTCIVSACGSKDSGGTQNQEQMSWQDQYDLGIRLLSEGKYEEAVLAFRAAIQIDPKNVDAYLGLADVYVAMNNGQAAADVLRQGWKSVGESDRDKLEDKMEDIVGQFPDVDPDIDSDEKGDQPGNITKDDDPDSDAVITAMEEVIAAQFDYAAPFHEGYACVGYRQTDGTMKYGFINTEGTLISGLYDYAGQFSEGLAAVGNRVDVSGSDAWYSWNETYYFGYINTEGQEVIPLRYLCSSEVIGARPFYQGLAEVCWYSDREYQCATNLVDVNGNHVLPEDIIFDGVLGHGGGMPEDPRPLTLLHRKHKSYDSYYSYWNPVQNLRCDGKETFSARYYNGTDTCTMNEKFEITGVIEGFYIELSGTDGMYMIFEDGRTEFGQGYGIGEGTVYNAAGDPIISNILTCDVLNGQYLYVGRELPPDDSGLNRIGYVYTLYDMTGQEVAFPGQSISAMEDGYIVYDNIEGSQSKAYRVLDLEMNEIFSAVANNLYRVTETLYKNGSYETVSLPIYECSVYDETTSRYHTEFLNMEGQQIIPYEAGMEQYQVDALYLASIFNNQLRVYSFSGNVVAEFSGVDRFYRAYFEDVEEYGYQTSSQDGNVFYLAEATAESLVLTEVTAYQHPMYGNYTLTPPDGGEVMIRSNLGSALYGNELDWEQPLTLKQGEKTVTTAPGLSLISNHLYKQADTIIWNADRFVYDVSDIRVCAADGSWSSETYEDMGYLSENFISFCENGKWGYLGTVKERNGKFKFEGLS